MLRRIRSRVWPARGRLNLSNRRARVSTDLPLDQLRSPRNHRVHSPHSVNLIPRRAPFKTRSCRGAPNNRAQFGQLRVRSRFASQDWAIQG